MKRTPLKRASSLRRTTRIKNAKPAVRSAQAKQRANLRRRCWNDWLGFFRCEFLLPYRPEHPFLELQELQYIRCQQPYVDMAHIVPRRECGKARDSVSVVIAACRACHAAYDSSLTPNSVRPHVPQRLLAGAKRAIESANLKAPLKQSIKEKLNG